jgi:para-nitrobenzyl esterase
MQSTNLLLLSLAVITLTACGGSSSSGNLQIDNSTRRTLDQGNLVGTRGRENTLAWYGIPYAESPTGELRWRAPRSHSGWHGELTAINFRHRCTQYAADMDEHGESGDLVGSEDCLYLNVWAPSEVSADKTNKLPVMLWIHGGGNVWGYAGQHEMGKLAASQNVIVVSLNHRLGPFGWFAHESIRSSAEQPLDKSSNFGTLDIIQALEWTGQNIQVFGGDPNNITVFGESAGGLNVGSLLVSPLAQGKFHQAIVQSGGFDSHTLREAEFGPETQDHFRGHASTQAITKLGENADTNISNHSPTDMARWLRSLPSADIMAAYVDLQADTQPASEHSIFGINNIGITNDGIVIPTSGMASAFETPGGVHNVPVLFGTNRDETLAISLTNEDLFDHISFIYIWPTDLELYQAYGGYPSLLWRAFGVDEPADKLLKSGHKDVYTYRFDWDEQGNALFSDISTLVGAAHALEVAFISGGFEDHVNDPRGIYFDEGNRAGREWLSQAMMSYWAQFAYSGAPARGRTDDLPLWQVRSAANGPTTMLLDTQLGGGLRMTNKRVSISQILTELTQDPRLENDKERCMVLEVMRKIGTAQREQIDPYHQRYCPLPPNSSSLTGQ